MSICTDHNYQMKITKSELFIQVILHYLACKGGAISLIRVQVNSLIREFHHAKLPYKQVTNTMLFNSVFDHKSLKIDIFPRYIFANKGVEIGNSLISKQATPLQARLCSTSIYVLKIEWVQL
ncbi:Hypothetical_protein [Hexamita inflata]|uniref:Hypothetical_protein n=1 Tax=Hexamita inflata TaxID=28002 RepID=A0AA86THY5_9EUKA|nr:Hypothetical protein HINF_LOCUS6824 [Hexamita inflata]